MSLSWLRADQAERNARILSTDHLTSSLGRRTASGGVLAIGSQVIRMVLQLVQAAIMARLLAPEDFGLVAMAVTVTGFVSLFTDLGLSAATVQRKEIDQDTVSALFFMNIAMGLIVMLACCAAAPVAGWFFKDTRVTLLVISMAATIPLGAAGAQHNALLTRGMRWWDLQWTQIMVQLAGMVSGILLAWKTDLGYWALVWASWAGALVGLALMWAVCPWRPSWVRDWAGARGSLNFGAYLTGFNLINYFHRQFDNVLVGWRWGAVELGFYSRAYTLLTMPLTLVNGPVGSVIVPALSRLQHQPDRWRRAYLDALALVTLIGSCIAMVLIVTAEPLVTLLFGSAWEKTATIFRYLAISIFAATPMNTAGWIYISLGKTDRMFRWSYLSTPIIIAAFSVGIPFGASGLALCYSITMWLILVPCLVYSTRETCINSADLVYSVFPFMLSGVVGSLLVCYLINYTSFKNLYIEIIFKTCLSLLVYIFIASLFALFIGNTRKFLVSIVRRLGSFARI